MIDKLTLARQNNPLKSLKDVFRVFFLSYSTCRWLGRQIFISFLKALRRKGDIDVKDGDALIEREWFIINLTSSSTTQFCCSVISVSLRTSHCGLMNFLRIYKLQREKNTMLESLIRINIIIAEPRTNRCLVLLKLIRILFWDVRYDCLEVFFEVWKVRWSPGLMEDGRWKMVGHVSAT